MARIAVPIGLSAAKRREPESLVLCPRFPVRLRSESDLKEGPDDAANKVRGRAGRRDAARAGSRREDCRCMSAARRRQRDLLGKAKFGGLEVADAKRLKGLEAENGKLKRRLADAMPDNTALKDLLGRTW